MDTRVADGWILAELIHAVWLSAAARQRFIAGAILRADHPTGGNASEKAALNSGGKLSKFGLFRSPGSRERIAVVFQAISGSASARDSCWADAARLTVTMPRTLMRIVAVRFDMTRGVLLPTID